MKKISIIALVLLSFAFTVNSQNRAKGLNFDDNAYSKVLQKATLTRGLYYSLPTSFSLKAYAPTPKSQGQYGTCTGWATAYCALTIADSKANNVTDKELITQNAFSPGFIYKQIKDEGDASCALGASIREALEIMKTKGAAKYDALSEVNCPTSLSAEVFKDAENHKISDYAKVFDGSETSTYIIAAVKKSLSQENPVIIGMKAPPSFDSAGELWTPTEDSEDSFGGHAMCVIGYDDEKFGGAFEIQNSWGTSWGKDGYFWISYENFPLWVKYAYELIDMAAPVSADGYDMKGSVRMVLSNGTDAQINYEENIYKIREPQKSGSLFRLHISNSSPAYVYAFGTDATNKVFPVFPHAPTISAALTYSQNDVAIPDEEHFIQTDNTVGKDYLCVVYSKEPLLIKDIHSKLENETGTFYQKVNKVLGNKVIDNNSIVYEKDRISFKAKTKNKTIAFIIIESDHVK